MSTPQAFVQDPRFDRVFVLPADLPNGRANPFTVQYSDYGYRNEEAPENENVFLFFGSLLGSRLVHVAKDELAKQHRIRIINPDRPGVGGTDIVKPECLMSLWRETILALLRHLDIKYVSIGCHSGGTISALDMLVHHPEILPPENPGYIAIGSPWILPSHTGSTMMSIVECFPSSVIGQVDKIARLINNHVGPMVGLSVGVSYAMVNKLMPSPALESAGNSHTQSSRTFEERVWPEIIQRIYDSNIKGMSTDAIMFLQKGCFSQAGWGDWGDYDKLVPRLSQILRSTGRNLRIDVFHAESDSLVGNAGSRGSLWFDQCWQAGNEDVINYSSAKVIGADHDGVWSLKWSAVHTVFERINGKVEDR
ncbi:hypothetical protein PFICI_06517 [Pestalotiopsis fici W106-1]|uniref:AB hydrolase-1 domain-containing protein n=1 Tax=Pestalotiopsis fici (strain W106-1 / CGMCC3.15140) TaxID=1229662 RepID=W3X638_PESFW|nr:uncharacterized protein PFICI_06517 [Pestalotiopsis fici W106-1]ETS81515.1 hypothetical protein PFICI_06517 [Pestalotiopsis fici W106-1]